MKDIFDPGVTEEQLRRIRALSADRRPLWGKMDAGQMLAHLCVVYELTYETRHRRPGPLLRWLLRTFVKRGVVGEKPYPRNSPTAPAFRISTPRDFEHERERLIDYLRRTQALGREAFEGRDYPSFGPMTAEEWNTLFFKHLDHHLTQFGV
jgi:hypothetical protein